MLAPKKVKFRKWQKGRLRGLATRGASIAFGYPDSRRAARVEFPMPARRDIPRSGRYPFLNFSDYPTQPPLPVDVYSGIA